MQYRHDAIMGLWEQLNNPNFNRVEFDTFRNEAGHFIYSATAHNTNNITKRRKDRCFFIDLLLAY